ncbi:hypothetical protein JT358_12135 [Micrococcales bacterium 31B]|nr:hypothetical protein [Micrococcales bacterium 31B]
MSRSTPKPPRTKQVVHRERRITTILLWVFLIGFLAIDFHSEKFDFSTVRGWLQLLAPYLSVMGLLVAPRVAAALWFLAFALVFPLGADPLLLGAYIFPTGITLGLCGFGSRAAGHSPCAG